jgi:hypothetical protein
MALLVRDDDAAATMRARRRDPLAAPAATSMPG